MGEGGAAGLYGPPSGVSSKSVEVAKPVHPAPVDWDKTPFYCLQTELSPATLYHSTTSHLSFLAGMKDFGLDGPSFVAYAAADSTQIIRPGEAFEVGTMNECWILAWFAGSSNWADWDSPWVVFLQKKPKSAKFTKEELSLEFSGPAGYAVLMPLYGYYKPPQKGKKAAGADLVSSDIRTWEWSAGLPAEVLKRVRWWASVSREFPVYCQETFSIDRAADTVTIRQRFEWISIDDDWKTRHIRFAPASPVLAHAALEGKFPVKFSKALTDSDLFTPYGPYMGVEGADGFDATLHVLQYINECEATDPPDAKAHPTVTAALEKLRATARTKFKKSDRYEYDHGGLNNFCWAVMGDQWHAKGLPYYDETTRKVAIESLRKYFHDDVLVQPRFAEREFPQGSGRKYLILEGPGIGSWGVLGDAGKFSTNLCETLGAYAHYTGDWDLLKERWPLVRRLFCTGARRAGPPSAARPSPKWETKRPPVWR